MINGRSLKTKIIQFLNVMPPCSVQVFSMCVILWNAQRLKLKEEYFIQNQFKIVEIMSELTFKNPFLAKFLSKSYISNLFLLNLENLSPKQVLKFYLLMYSLLNKL